MPHFGQANVILVPFNALLAIKATIVELETDMRQFEYWLRGVWALLGFGFKGQTVAVYRHRPRHLR